MGPKGECLSSCIGLPKSPPLSHFLLFKRRAALKQNTKHGHLPSLTDTPYSIGMAHQFMRRTPSLSKERIQVSYDLFTMASSVCSHWEHNPFRSEERVHRFYVPICPVMFERPKTTPIPTLFHSHQ